VLFFCFRKFLLKKIMKKKTKAEKKQKTKADKKLKTKSKKKKKEEEADKNLKTKSKKQKLTKKLKTKIEDVNINNNNGDMLSFHGSVRPVCICISSRKAEQKGDFFSHISCL
jgi:hypothetical protein